MRLLLCLIFLIPQVLEAKDPRKRWTHAQDGKWIKHDPMDVYPQIEVPQNSEKYTWKASSGVFGRESGGEIPVYRFRDGAMTRIGNLPDDTEVKLFNMMRREEGLFYGIPWKNGKIASRDSKNKDMEWGWIDGQYIYPASYNGE